MERNSFGRELDGNIAFGITLEEFKNLMLYHLEDYLFHTKFNDKINYISIPMLDINIITEDRYALDLRTYFNIPQISFDENGCLYDNGKEKAYVSPEFFAKCFIERVINVWTAISTLYMPKTLMEQKKKESDDEFAIGIAKLSKEKEFKYMDFVDIYNKLVTLKKLNNNLNQGLIGLIPDYSDNNRILNLRKIEFAAQVQKDIEFVLEKINKELYEEKIYDINNEDLYESEEYKNLIQEHDRLFRSGPFIEALEPQEWQTRDAIYDEGTDEEREIWRLNYESLKKAFEIQRVDKIKKSLKDEIFPLFQIQKKVIEYLKIKIYTYNYQRNQGDLDNPLINELGLDQTRYYAHPADKYMPQKTMRILDSYSLEEADESDYDMIYGGNIDNIEDEYPTGGYLRF